MSDRGKVFAPTVADPGRGTRRFLRIDSNFIVILYTCSCRNGLYTESISYPGPVLVLWIDGSDAQSGHCM